MRFSQTKVALPIIYQQEQLSRSDSWSFIKSDPDFFPDKLDQSPMYPNGVNGILWHISENYRYHDEAIQKGIEGKVYVTFLINPDG